MYLPLLGLYLCALHIKAGPHHSAFICLPDDKSRLAFGACLYGWTSRSVTQFWAHLCDRHVVDVNCHRPHDGILTRSSLIAIDRVGTLCHLFVTELANPVLDMLVRDLHQMLMKFAELSKQGEFRRRLFFYQQ